MANPHPATPSSCLDLTGERAITSVCSDLVLLPVLMDTQEAGGSLSRQTGISLFLLKTYMLGTAPREPGRGDKVLEEAALTLSTRLPVPHSNLHVSSCHLLGRWADWQYPSLGCSQIGSVVPWLPLSYSHLCLRETKHYRGQTGLSQPFQVAGRECGTLWRLHHLSPAQTPEDQHGAGSVVFSEVGMPLLYLPSQELLPRPCIQVVSFCGFLPVS